ncbi:tyrosine-type recombinase/integrase [Kocuria marina]|uniref:tyrosine-type recombinase/integrase n=1 Tax=Kocuria marina TaxID=223184 RepID=UPI00380842C4
MIEKRIGATGVVRWRVRYRTPDYRQRSKTFARRRDAEDFQAEVRRSLHQGLFIDPNRGKITLRVLWDEYERTGMGHLRATTRAQYRTASRHFLAQFGRWPVGKIEHADVADWVTALSKVKGPSAVRSTYRVLCLLLDHGMRTRRISHNVARGVRMPRQAPARERVLPVQQVEALAVRMGREGDLVLTMAFLGLRWSELAALTVADVDLSRGRVRVVERATEVAGRIDVSAPKSRASHREVGVMGSLRSVLAARIEGKAPDDLVFSSPEGGYLRNGNWRNRSGWFDAVAELGLDGITPHDLRRSFGSLARMAGADLRWIQKAMGHESITTTARIYAHLYDDELDAVAAALDTLRTPVTGVGEG